MIYALVMAEITGKRTLFQAVIGYFWLVIGSFLAALAIRVFLYPNQLIDGGVVGISLILGRLTSDGLISLYLLLINLPFIYLAYRYIRRTFVIQMLVAVLLFAFFLMILERAPAFSGDSIEIIAIGGALLGIGCGLIIRYGGCLDGSEILGIIVNKKFGFTVGQVVLFFNIFVFASYGIIFLDWHIAVKSLLTYIVAFKMIDMVIVGMDEIKSVTIISSKSEEVRKVILEELGLGVTITHGRGGYSGEEKNILNVIVERLDLAGLKELILNVDSDAFLSVSNIYEVIYGRKTSSVAKKKIRSKKRNFL
jgi:uncharacterized membrane-anchored protein YitT (DUF2179 family)